VESRSLHVWREHVSEDFPTRDDDSAIVSIEGFRHADHYNEDTDLL